MNSSEQKRRIAALLHENARMADQEIADRLAIPQPEVTKLIAEMENDGTIMGYHALVDPEAFTGNPVRAIIEVEVQPERDGGFDRVARAVSRFAEVESVYLVSGRYDLRLEVVGDSLQEVAFFVASKLAPMEGIRATATHFLLKKYKEVGFLLEKDEGYERLKITP
jgi:DNA-binding Lrp family transcriptional regulator